jgi:hypothetical protein
MRRLWHFKEWPLLAAGFAVVVAMACVCVVVMRVYPGLRSGQAADDESVSRQSAPAPGAAAGRDVSHPAPVDVPMAAIGQDDANQSEFISVDIGGVRPVESARVVQAPGAAPSDNQSDAEHLDAPLESSHAVAPVPVQDSAGAAAAAPLALLGGLGMNADRRVLITTAATGVPAWMDCGWVLGARLDVQRALGSQFLDELPYEQTCGELIAGLRGLTYIILQIGCPTF